MNNKAAFAGIILLICQTLLYSGEYYSNDIFEPDKIGFVWLMKNYVDTNARFYFVKCGETVKEAIPFDLPTAKYRRYATCSTSMYVVKTHRIADVKAVKLAQYIDEIELDRWSDRKSEKAKFIESSLRKIFETNSDVDSILEKSFLFISTVVDSL